MHLGPSQSFWDFSDVWKHDCTFIIWGSGFGCEDLIILCFYLQMLKDNMLKPTNETYSKCKYQLKQKTITREKMLQLIKSMFFENRSEVSKP